MSRTTVERRINAPVDLVFRAISDPATFSMIAPDVTHVEFLSEKRTGVGTKFRETRKINGKESTTELEITEYVPGERVRFVSDTQGTIWDSIYTLESSGDDVALSFVMEARPYKLTARIMTPIAMGFVSKLIEKDIDGVKNYCEAEAERIVNNVQAG